MRVCKPAEPHVVPVLATGRLLLDNLVVLLGLVFVNSLPIVLLGLALDLLHLGALVLEPDLDHAHAQPRLLGQRLPDLPARLRAHLERGLELATLRRREDRSGSFGASTSVAGSTRLVQQVVVAAAGLLHQVHLLLEVLAAEELAGPKDELLALLERLAADDAHEAGQVEDVLLGSHHHLVGQQSVSASRALYAEYSAGKCALK